MSLTTRSGRVKLPPEQPSIPQRKGGTGAYWMYLLPGFVLLLVIVVVPLIWNVYLTFTEWRGVGEPEFIGLENWQKLVTDEDFWTSFANSVWMVLAMRVGLSPVIHSSPSRAFQGRVVPNACLMSFTSVRPYSFAFSS